MGFLLQGHRVAPYTGQRPYPAIPTKTNKQINKWTKKWTETESTPLSKMEVPNRALLACNHSYLTVCMNKLFIFFTRGLKWPVEKAKGFWGLRAYELKPPLLHVRTVIRSTWSKRLCITFTDGYPRLDRYLYDCVSYLKSLWLMCGWWKI